MQRVIERAAGRIRALSPPGPDEPAMPPLMEVLREEGLLAACAPAASGGRSLAHQPPDPAVLLEALAAIGGANLSVGRLFEGHVNAVKLVALFAEGDDRRFWLDEVARGRLFGVWGADGPEPVRIAGGRLSGAKLYASGADVLDYAVISARDGDGAIVLFVLPAERLAGRLFPDEWSMTGMRATASGRCNLDGLALRPDDMLGQPGDYHREPHFQGGVWRYAAAQLGAMRAILQATAAQLDRRGQAAAPLQVARLRRMTTACETARLWLLRAASAVEQPGASPSAAAASILARLVVADEATELLARADAALGAASFATAHPVERHRRDLLVYLRQANPDGLEQAAMATLLAEPCLAGRWHLA